MDPATAIAVGQVSANVVSIIWKYYSEVKDAKSNIMHLANEIQDFHDVMQRFQDLLQKGNLAAKIPASGSLKATIEQSLLDIKALESKLDPGTGAKVMKRFGKRALKWPLTKKEVDEWVTKFQRLKATANLALNTDQTSLILGVDANVTQLKQGQQAIEQEQQLGKLPFAADSSFDSYYRQHESQCIANTRVELLQRLQDWGADHERPIFWLTGMAGTGKSTIARTLANNFKSQKTLGGNFFFSRGSGKANNAVNFVGTLAHHLANTSPQLKECICHAVSIHSDSTRQGLRSQWQDFVIGPLSRIKLKGRPTLNFVIDALDECDSDDDIRLLLQLFVEVKDLNTIDLGVFVTSRPEIVIRLGFEDMPEIFHHNLDLRDIPRQTVERDISILLEQELGRISLQHKLHDWPSEDNIRLLVQKADCLFIYAATACRFVGDRDWDPTERLSEILQGDSVGGGNTAQLDEMYMQVLRCSLIKGRREGDIARLCDLFKSIVGSVVVLFDELSAPALAKLLSLPVKTVDVSLGKLHSVLNLSSNPDSPIRLLHPSFHDFLLDEKRCEDKRFFVEEVLMHGNLVMNCLKTISAALKRNSCRLPTPGSSPQDVQSETLNKQLPKHVQYACQYWVDHLAGTKPDSRAQLGLRDDGEIHIFFREDFLHWLEAMSLMGKMSQGVLMITRLANMTELGQHHTLHAMVEDAERFILSNRTIIEKAPLQTYASALVFSPTGSLIRKRYSDQLPAWLVRLPAVENRWSNCVQTLEGHQSRINAIAFSPEGKFFASASDDKTIRLWDPATGALHSTLEGHDESVKALAFSCNGHLASASRDGTIRLWEPITGVTSRIIDINFRPVSDIIDYSSISLFFLPKGDLAVYCFDEKVRIWRWEKESLSDPILPEFKNCRLRGSSPQGKLAVEVYGKDSDVVEVLLYDSTTGAAQSLKTDITARSYYAVAFSSDNKMAFGFSDGTIELHDLATGSHRKLKGHSKTVGELAFSPDSRFLVSGSSNGTLLLWELSTQAQSMIGTCTTGIMSIAFSPDGKRIALSCWSDSTVQLWRPVLRATKSLREDHPRIITGVFFSPSGDQVASISPNDGKIQLYDTVRGALEYTLLDHSEEVKLITFSRDGKQLASVSGDKSVRLWDPRTGTRSQVLSDDLGIATRLVFSSDGKQLASGDNDGQLRIWDLEIGNLRHKFKGPDSEVSAIAFSPAGNKIASVFYDRIGRVWDTMTGDMLHQLEGLAGYSDTIAFSPNDRYLAWQSHDSSMTFYNVETKTSRKTLEIHGDVTVVAFSSDSKSLASSSWSDQTIKLWDVGTALLLRTFSIDSTVWQLSFSADGAYLETEKGHISIGEVAEDAVNTSSTHGSHWRIFGREWVMEGNRKMLWLPPEFRELGIHDSRIAHHNGLFVFGLKSGKFVFLGLTQDKVVTEIEE